MRSNFRRRQPHVVPILAADIGWSDPGCYGHEISTPHPDTLAQLTAARDQWAAENQVLPKRNPVKNAP